jgi:hypothetical protein
VTRLRHPLQMSSDIVAVVSVLHLGMPADLELASVSFSPRMMQQSK